MIKRDVTILCDRNFNVLCRHVNENESNIEEILTAMTKLTKKCKHKASKLSVFFAVAAGVVYIVKNELDKNEMKTKLIDMDRQKRCSDLEDEGEATGPLFT